MAKNDIRGCRRAAGPGRRHRGSSFCVTFDAISTHYPAWRSGSTRVPVPACKSPAEVQPDGGTRNRHRTENRISPGNVVSP